MTHFPHKAGKKGGQFLVEEKLTLSLRVSRSEPLIPKSEPCTITGLTQKGGGSWLPAQSCPLEENDLALFKMQPHSPKR